MGAVGLLLRQLRLPVLSLLLLVRLVREDLARGGTVILAGNDSNDSKIPLQIPKGWQLVDYRWLPLTNGSQ